MNQRKNILGFTRTSGWCKSMCVVMILFAYMLVLPTSAMALESDGNQMVNQQQVAVKGIVLDPEGEPVIGATVQVEGTSTGTITDIDGNFSLFASQDAVLVISYVGYAGQKVKVSQQLMRIVLQEDSELLDEVVVVGYGAVKRANLTGAVTTTNIKEIEDIPATNLASTLMGTMSGVTIDEATGNPIGTPTIQIRVAGSWNADPPLYVIDGFIRDADAFNLLDPSEIESISVLKDAQAAVYGVRGSGGVILVSTKKGKEQKTQINYSGSVGFSQGVNMPDMMSAYQQATALNDMYDEMRKSRETVDNYKYFTGSDLERMKNVNYNWLDGAWQNAVNTRHTLNVSGGNEKVRYFLGGNYIYSNGNFPDLNVQRYGFRSGIDINFTKEFKGSFGISYTEKNSKMPLNQGDTQPELMYGTFSDLLRVSRWISPYIDGKPVNIGGSDDDPTAAVSHPLEVLNSGSSKINKGNDIALNGKFDYDVKWVKGLSASLSLNYSKQSNWGREISRPYTVYNFEKEKIEGTNDNGHFYTNTVTGTPTVNNGNKYYESAQFSYSWQINPQVNYSVTLGNHDIAAMYVFEAAESGGNNLNLTRYNMILAGIDMLDAFETGDEVLTSAKMNTKSRRVSHIGRVNYSYMNRYLLEGTMRYEASTNFAPGYRWGLFGSISAAWRISEENWFRDNVRAIDDFKVRASYGRLGNDKISLNQWRQSYSHDVDKAVMGATPAPVFTLYPDMGGLTAYDSSWEKSDTYNFGVDLRFSNGIFVNLDGFYKYTFDILNEARTEFPQSAGISGKTPDLNYGKMEAWGGELELGYQKRLNKDWSINVKGNLSYADSRKIKAYQDPGKDGTWQNSIGTVFHNHITGYKMWKGVDGKGDGMARTWQDINDYIDYLKANSYASGGDGSISVLGQKEDELRPGMLMFEDRGTTLVDQTPNGIIDEAGDNCIIAKRASAPFYFGYTLGFTWKDLTVSALFNGSFGHQVVFDKGFYTTASGGRRSGDFLTETSNNLSEWYGNYALSDDDLNLINPDAKYPRLDSNSLRGERSEFWLRNGLNMRLRTINVSYTVPKNFTKSLGIASCRVFFTANNIWTIINPYPYKDAYVGYWSDYPQIRTFNFGLNISL